MTDLHLMALDAEDLQMISACCQDAVMKTSDLTWSASEQRFIMVMNRFAWEANAARRGFSLFRRAVRERRRSVLHFDRVTHVQQMGVAAHQTDEVLDLLTIRFTEDQAPSGHIDLVFAGNATIRLQVECIEAQLTDLGAAWSTQMKPDHDRA